MYAGGNAAALFRFDRLTSETINTIRPTNPSTKITAIPPMMPKANPEADIGEATLYWNMSPEARQAME